MAPAPDALIDRGRVALTACDWDAARLAFEEAVAADATPEALDGLGQALYWLGDYPQALALRERAYGLHRAADERREAAAIAVQLAMLHGLIYGNDAAVSGWVAHAERSLDGVVECPERGWLELFLACTTDYPDERQRRAEIAADIGRRLGERALEYDAIGYIGKALVERGLIDEGMRLIDEAVAATMTGLVVDPWATGEIYCTLFHACEMTVDVRRAEEWLGAVDRYVERTGELPVSGICRMHFGGLLTAAGRWSDAEEELLTAVAIYERTYRGTRDEVLVRLAELRVRQDRIAEARQLLVGADHHPDATRPLARIHLAEGEPELAAALLERHLVRRGRGVLSASVLALLVEAHLASGDTDGARAVADELTALAESTRRPATGGFAALSRARAAVADGADDATGPFEEAASAFAEAGLRWEAARSRLEHASSLAVAVPALATAEARAALQAFEELRASRDADAAAQLLRSLGDRRRPTPRSDDVLTRREAEVLDLLAEGLTNQEIADRLYISLRTAEHHVSNILSKLGLTNRTEAAAYVARTGRGGRSTPSGP